ncbi:Oidioi.mRNA.OKI2018_I69.chr1.g724.t1.cds [Oikopleura dioica]|uniref:Oidioi.mRNA.OKI2018_I69.chr1.g724.t1.cds n=1 Tax=Oikopleura dioica TaxID=34765 RepID=A0ABN7SQ22_OIKDI|nr:Oidioi.mRNA.OKI2018_I69.chr1.g724.t1.cds [Oikopleura dioica]
MSDLRFERCVDGSRKEEILKFLLENFLQNTLQKVLPFSVEQARFHWERSIAGCKNAQLVFSENDLVAVETGDLVSYRETKEESTDVLTENGENSKRTEEFLAEMSNVDLEKFGVTDQSKIYSNGVVCVSETMRGKKIGSKLVKNSIEFAT